MVRDSTLLFLLGFLEHLECGLCSYSPRGRVARARQMQRRHWHETTCSKLPWSRSVLPPIEGETRPTIDMAQFRQRFANSAVAVVGDATAEVLYIALVQVSEPSA